MFAVTERQLRGLIAPITPFYGTSNEWMGDLNSNDELATFDSIYRNQPAVRSVVDFIAGHCARMPVKLFKQEGGGTGDSNEGDREHLRTHPLQKLLNVPNGLKRQGRSNFWNDAWKDFLIYDRVCLVKIKDIDSGSPVALVRIPPVWFTPMGRSYWYPDYIHITGNRGMHDIPIDNCVYIHGYDPVDPRIGVSPMMALKGILEEEAASMAWRNRFWDQGVQASMIVSRPVEAADWDDGARDRFIESLRAASARGRPLLLEDGMTSNPAAGFDPKSAQYIQSKEFTREEVLRVYNLPIGLFEQANSANIAQYRAFLYAETLAPILGRFIDELETQLLTEWVADPYGEGMYLEPAIEEKLRGNIMEQIAMFTAATGGPIMLRSEARAFMNLRSLPEDKAKPDKLIVPMAVVVDGEVNGGTGQPEPPPAPPGQASDPNESKPKNPANQNGPAKPPEENDTDTRADEGPQRRAAAALPAPTKARTDSDTKAFDRFQKKAVTTLSRFAKRQAASLSSSGKFNKGRWNKELAADLAPLRQEVSSHFGSRAAGRWNAEFDPERMREYNEVGAEKQANLLNTFTENDFSRAVEAGALAGLGALLLTRMEAAADDTVQHMASFGYYEAAKQTGKRTTKTWQTQSDSPRPSHAAMDGEEVGLEETFSNGLRYPHDPAGDASETTNCKCVIELSVSDEERPTEQEPE